MKIKPQQRALRAAIKAAYDWDTNTPCKLNWKSNRDNHTAIKEVEDGDFSDG